MSSAPANDRLDVTVEDDGRYHRQSLISWWQQDRLAAAKVLVVGAGALGNELIKTLTLLGVGTIVVVDLDRVENSNLSRCVLFRESDEGEFKATVVARAAKELNPDVEVIPVVGDVRSVFGIGLFAAVDVVLGGLDNREARVFVNQACWKAGTPFVDGAIEGLMGVMRSFVPPGSACYECTMSDRDRELLAARKACSLLTRDQMLEGRVPTTATSASIVASMQVQEAVKLVHRDLLDYTFGGKGFAYNGLTHDSYPVTYPRDEACLAHDSYDEEDRVVVDPGASLGTLLKRAEADLGAGAVLDLEHDIVLAMACEGCDTVETVMRPLFTLKVGEGLCPTCDAARKFDAVHSVTRETTDLHDRGAADLGLAPFDAVTARLGMERRFYLLGAPADVFTELRGSA